MRTMLLTGGDLSIGETGDYATCTDATKVRQDVRNALLEPLGNDRFHPGWGSTLSDFVGLQAGDYERAQVLGEVNRVVGNYAAVQRDKITTDVLSARSSRYTTDEVLSSVGGVSVVGTQDRFSVRIAITTVSGSEVVLDETLS